MSVPWSRTECLMGGHWLVRWTGDDTREQMRLPEGDLETLPGDVERDPRARFPWVLVERASVERMVRYDATPTYDGVPVTVMQVLDGRVELYNATGEAASRGWEGNLHDGWSLWVLAEELGEVSVSETELAPDGSS